MVLKKNTKFIITILLLLLCRPAFAWEKFKTYDVWIDKDSIYSTERKENKFVHIWAIANNPLPTRKDVKSIKSLLNINCTTHYVNYTYKYYSQLQGGGEVLDESYWEGPIEPNTLYNDLFQDYCKAWWKFW